MPANRPLIRQCEMPRRINVAAFLIVGLGSWALSRPKTKARFLRQPFNRSYRPNLYRSDASAGKPGRDLDSFFHTLRFDHEITANLFTRLGERTIRYESLPVAHTHTDRLRTR